MCVCVTGCMYVCACVCEESVNTSTVSLSTSYTEFHLETSTAFKALKEYNYFVTNSNMKLSINMAVN